MITSLPLQRPAPRFARAWIAIAPFALLLGAGALVYAQIEGDRGIPPIASGGDFEVSGVKVDGSGKNADEARSNAWREAQRKGWQKLWSQMNRSGAAPKLSDSALDGIVSAIVVENEQIGPRRYIATLGVLFDRARAGELLGVSGSVLRSAPMLVVPIYISGGSAQTFENRTPWQAAWARYRTAESIVDYIRPYGSGADSLLVNAAQSGRRSRTWWRLILDQFGAADVVVPVVHVKRQYPGGPITGRFAARFGPDSRLLGSFTLRARNSDGLAAMLDEGIKRLDRIYAGAVRSGELRPDSSLIIEKPVEVVEELLDETLAEDVPVEPGGLTTGTQIISIQFDTPDVAAVQAGERLVRGIPGVNSASTASLALGGTSVMQVNAQIDIDALRGALEARGYRVQQGPGVLRISRAAPAPGGGG
ncbi:heavy-metal-associated domain-containing protein [Blastomonas sp. UPD001]|uniref:heavy-metal-associated domain-containing protein n=1 Tax=Blastomonas sp. UPD001 TaxID=2217673 RepID=UPI000E341F2D|nr:heavy-metal-associated domain-containing protein [Blastomonas sp. UPD001]